MSDDKGYLVVIEWDGIKPPTAFYHRIRKLTSGVRQNDSETLREISPFARREERNDNAVIMQEGAIYCVSKSLARAVALLAEQYGAPNVELATVSKMKPVVATTEDLEALSRIQKILGRRGRPPSRNSRDVSITCFEEVITKAKTVEGYDVLNCPDCGSLSITTHYGYGRGTMDNFEWYYMKKQSLFYAWATRRTAHGDGITFYNLNFHRYSNAWKESDPEFERAPYSMGLGFATSDPHTIMHRYDNYNKQQKDVLDLMIRSDLDDLDALCQYPEDVVRILDAIFVGRLMYNKEEQLEARLMALSGAMVRYPEIGGDYLLALNEDKVDFFDAAPVIPVKEMLDYFTAIRSYKLEKQVQVTIA